jgi:spore germination cell wall hydrolase CwlJ-like protein
MNRVFLFAAFAIACSSTAQAAPDDATRKTCTLYGVGVGDMWEAVHEKHMTLEQVNDGLADALGKQKYYRMMAMQQAVLDNPRYANATAMTVAVMETAGCMQNPARILAQY